MCQNQDKKYILIESYPDQESIRVLMNQCWNDHQKTREQTWKGLQIEVSLVAGLIAIQFSPFYNKYAVIGTALIPIILGISGIGITKHHRNYQIEKFKIIAECERKLGLDKIVGSKSLPKKIKLWHIINPSKNNTPLFIIRMHCALILFSLIVIILNWKLLIQN